MSSEETKSDAQPEPDTASAPGGAVEMLGKVGTMLIYPPVMASAGALVLGMAGALFTLDLPAAEDGLSFLLMGVFVQAPLLGIGAALVAIVCLTATMPLHKNDFQWGMWIALGAGVCTGLAWCVVKILLTGVEMSFWPGVVGAVLGGIAGLVIGIAGLGEDNQQEPENGASKGSEKNTTGGDGD